LGEEHIFCGKGDDSQLGDGDLGFTGGGMAIVNNVRRKVVQGGRVHLAKWLCETEVMRWGKQLFTWNEICKNGQEGGGAGTRPSLLRDLDNANATKAKTAGKKKVGSGTATSGGMSASKEGENSTLF